MLLSLTDWLKDHMIPCFFKKNFGIDCPTCGLQRSFIELLEGHFKESFMTFPAIYPLVALFVFLVLHLKFNFEKGARIIVILFIFTVTIIVVSYIIKII